MRQTHDLIERIYNTLKKEHIENVAQKAKLLNSDFTQIKEEVVKKIVDNLKKFDETSLPLQGQTLHREIKLLFLELQKNQLEPKEAFEVETLYVKRLPQIISEYASIPERYRKQLTGKDSPDEILIDSLKEIKNRLSAINELGQEGKINQMKASNRYLKSMG